MTRYIQWSVTTPTLIYVVSKISDFTRGQVSLVVLAQASVIWSGLISSILPSPWKCKLQCILVIGWLQCLQLASALLPLVLQM